MSQETSYAVVAIFAFVGIVGNVIAFLFAKLELRAQKKETEHLTRLTSELQNKVNRLATELDYKIRRLERLRDLVNGIWNSTVELNQRKNRPNAEKFDFSIVRNSTLPELQALANTVRNDKLTAFTTNLVNNLENPIWDEFWFGGIVKDFDEVEKINKSQRAIITKIHELISELIEDVTWAGDN